MPPPLPILAERPAPPLRVSDLRQWTYCPRVVWWTHVCPVGKHESFKMKLGQTKELRLQRLQKRRTLHAFGLTSGTITSNVNLHSARLNLSGRLDLLIERGPHHYPVEIKFTRGPARLNHRLQLAGYAMLLEDTYHLPVSHGYIVRLPDDTVDLIPIDAPLLDLAHQTLAALRHTLLTEHLPPATPHLSHCLDCEYLRFCGDIL